MKERFRRTKFVQKIENSKLFRSLSSHRIFGRFFNYEFILYVICGVFTTLINYGIYFILPFGKDGFGVLLKTAIAWVAAVLFAYFSNKIFVFDSPSFSGKVLGKELGLFFVARLLSLGFDAAFMYVTVSLLNGNELLFKLLSNIFVLIANYFASKLVIFTKK